MRLSAQLYMRPGCHLCEVAEADLRRLAQTLCAAPARPSRVETLLRGVSGLRSTGDTRWDPIELELQLIDIDSTADAGLLERYTDRVPTLAVGGREYSAPLSAELLEQALRAAASDVLQAGDRADAARSSNHALAASADSATRRDPPFGPARPGQGSEADPTVTDSASGHVGGATDVADHPNTAGTVSSQGAGTSANGVPDEVGTLSWHDAAASSGDPP